MSKKGPSVEGVTRERLIELYVNDPDASLETIGQMFGVHHQTVSRWLKRFGIPSKPKTRSGRVKFRDERRRLLEDRNWLKAQLESGKMTKDVAADIGVKPAVVSYWAVKHGLNDEDKSRVVRAALAKRYPNGRYGEEASRWQGGRHINRHTGYVQVYAPDHPYARQGRVFEHRLVMEQHLGRYLEPSEVVHHLNGDRTDNRIENLELLTNGEHIAGHFLASHEVVELRAENARLRARIAELEEALGRLRTSRTSEE